MASFAPGLYEKYPSARVSGPAGEVGYVDLAVVWRHLMSDGKTYKRQPDEVVLRVSIRPSDKKGVALIKTQGRGWEAATPAQAREAGDRIPDE